MDQDGTKKKKKIVQAKKEKYRLIDIIKRYIIRE